MFIVFLVSYSVIFNGNSYGLIKPGRGIRQGDPLSPSVCGSLSLCNEESISGGDNNRSTLNKVSLGSALAIHRR